MNILVAFLGYRNETCLPKSKCLKSMPISIFFGWVLLNVWGGVRTPPENPPLIKPGYLTSLIYKVPELNWKDLISCLDHPGFLISTVEALRLIVTACHKGLQEIFPIELLYRSWSNTEGQVC